MAADLTTPRRPLAWLITGSSSGFGLSLVRRVQSQGHNVIATSCNPSSTPDLVEEVESKGGQWVKLDVDDPNSAQVIEGIEKSGQHIDVVIDNAGSALFFAVEQSTEEEVRSMIETMYFGPYHPIRAVLPCMRKRRSGMVVNISSGVSLEGTESMGAYAGTEAGLDVSVLEYSTRLGSAAVAGMNNLPEDYSGSAVDGMIKTVFGGKLQAGSDKEKAVKAIYEVLVGEGVGEGRENERFLSLGRDISPRLKLVQDNIAHSVEVFGDVCNNVYREK
ncbi:MAG: hypothetical protein Q9170_001436 [Blastenia crenularia]